MDEGDVQRILAFDETMIGSDGIPAGDKPHPRLWGTFPRVLGHYCRETGLFPLETAVWKMTGLTARNFGLHGRGALAKAGRRISSSSMPAACGMPLPTCCPSNRRKASAA
jgi:N-acyl-D-aspartate/D-glutamate deacylase